MKYILLIIFIVASLITSFFLLDYAFALQNPTCNAPTCYGAITATTTKEAAIGTSTAQAGVRLLIVASSTGTSYFPLRILDLAQGPILFVRDDGKIAIATSSFTTSTVLVSGRVEIASGTTPGGILFSDGTFQSTAGVSAGLVPAENVTQGIFGSAVGGGNYVFPSNLAVSSSLAVGTSTMAPVGVIYFNGSIGVGTSSPVGDIDIYSANPQLSLIEKSSGQAWGLRSGAAGTKIFDIADLTGGNSLLAITTSGNVGLGQISPVSPLDILNNGGDATILFQAQGVVTAASSSGPKVPGTVGVGGFNPGYFGWFSPGNAITTNLYATSSISVGSSYAYTSATDFLKATNFSFSIPTNSQVTGIQASLTRGATSTRTVYDSGVKIVQNNLIIGDDRATSTPWNAADTAVSYGSPTDLWGLSWRPQDVNASNFGFAVSARIYQSGGVATATVRMDNMRVTVYYSQTGTVSWLFGGDNTVNTSTFKLSNSTTVGSMDYLKIDATGTLNILQAGAGLKFPSGPVQDTASVFSTSTTSDYSVRNTSTTINIPAFNLDVGPYEKWGIVYYLFTGSTSAADFRAKITMDAATGRCRLGIMTDGGPVLSRGLADGGNYLNYCNITGSDEGVAGNVPAGGTDDPMIVAAEFENDSSQNVVHFYFAQQAPAAATTTVYAGSYMEAYRITK